MNRHGELFKTIQDLVMCHSPSGMEAEVDALIIDRLGGSGHVARCDEAGNIVVTIPGVNAEILAITAHKDEIGAVVTEIRDDGRLSVGKLGGSYPWVYGEGVVDILGEHACLSGVLSFGSRHVSHASPQYVHKETAPLRWKDTWIETKQSKERLIAAGVRPGTRVVVGKHRKQPFLLDDHIASYTLDNKASVAILLELARRVRAPTPNVHLVFSAKEEIGAIGALHYTHRNHVTAMIALDVCPIAPEYTILSGPDPVLLAEDGTSHYDDAFNRVIRAAARTKSISLQNAIVSNFGSDASGALKQGHVGRAACLGFPTQNTHGYEIAHLGAISNCVEILDAVCNSRLTFIGGS